MDRRDFIKLLGAAGALGLLSGCSRGTGETAAWTPDDWQKDKTLPGLARMSPPAVVAAPTVKSAPQPSAPPPAAASSGALGMIPRSYWKASPPISSRLIRMGQPTRLTVHHEGCPSANWMQDATQVAGRLRQIQVEHRKRMRAGDIGYHFIIDRAGRVWEGRSLGYQGAHVRNNNENNIGVMLLGNFEIQQPSQSQIGGLVTLVRTVARHYGISGGRIYGHRELVSTSCPGKHVMSVLASLRNSNQLA